MVIPSSDLYTLTESDNFIYKYLAISILVDRLSFL